MTRWREARPHRVYEQYIARWSFMEWVGYTEVEDQLVEETFYDTLIDVTGWTQQLYRRCRLRWQTDIGQTGTPVCTDGSGMAPLTDWAVGGISASGFILEQPRTDDMLPWVQRVEQREYALIALDAVIPRGSHVRLTASFSTNDWRSSPILTLYHLVAPLGGSFDWEDVLARTGWELADSDTGRLERRVIQAIPLAQQPLPLHDTSFRPTVIEWVTRIPIEDLLITVMPGQLPHYLLPNPNTPMALATISVDELWFQPETPRQPEERTRTWIARQVLSRNSLR